MLVKGAIGRWRQSHYKHIFILICLSWWHWLFFHMPQTNIAIDEESPNQMFKDMCLTVIYSYVYYVDVSGWRLRQTDNNEWIILLWHACSINLINDALQSYMTMPSSLKDEDYDLYRWSSVLWETSQHEDMAATQRTNTWPILLRKLTQV